MKETLAMSLAVLTMTAASAAPITIVEDGAPRAAIIAAKNETKALEAAYALQDGIARMSGARLPVVDEGDAVAEPVSIYVGHTEAARKLGVLVPAGHDPAIRPDAFEEEGYVLKTVGNSIVIGGNSDGPYKGNTYAVYAFLEQLGCRWYFPGEWGEIIPETRTIRVPPLDVLSRPDFAVRRIWLSGWVAVSREEQAAYKEWGTRIGFNFDQEYPLVGDGFLGSLLDPNEYYKDHPEYFAMDKSGKREPGFHKGIGKYYDRHTMLCLSNPDVFTESVKNLKAAFAGQKKMNIVASNGFGISPPDGAPFCYCEQCLAASQNFRYPTYIHERMQSEEFFGFAARLAREFPDKYVSTMAYALREMPPQGVDLPPNVAVTIAPISCCVLHPNNDPSCWRRAEFLSLLKQWRALTPHVMIYDYNPGFLLGLFIPERDVANMAVNAPIYKRIGVKGMAREGRKAFMQTWISYYVTAKLLWNSRADVAALKEDFYTTFFGPDAGPHVQAWFDACENALVQATIHPHEDWLVNHIYTVPFAKGLHRHVEAARNARTTERQRMRVEAFALIADHLEAYAEMEQAEADLDYARAGVEAGRMLEDTKKLNAIWSFFLTPDDRPNPRPYFTKGRRMKYEELAAKTGGAKGALVAELPRRMRFRRDRFNEGVVAEWYRPVHDDSAWETKDTFFLWEAQDPPEDAAGRDYDGYGWYRGEFDVPQQFIGKPITFYCGGAINEAWVWVNGRYAGHKPHKIWWMWGHDFELDVARLVKPGKNLIAIRVWNDADVGGLYRRGFFWSPKEPPADQ